MFISPPAGSEDPDRVIAVSSETDLAEIDPKPSTDPQVTTWLRRLGLVLGVAALAMWLGVFQFPYYGVDLSYAARVLPNYDPERLYVTDETGSIVALNVALSTDELFPVSLEGFSIAEQRELADDAGLSVFTIDQYQTTLDEHLKMGKGGSASTLVSALVITGLLGMAAVYLSRAHPFVAVFAALASVYGFMGYVLATVTSLQTLPLFGGRPASISSTTISPGDTMVTIAVFALLGLVLVSLYLAGRSGIAQMKSKFGSSKLSQALDAVIAIAGTQRGTPPRASSSE